MSYIRKTCTEWELQANYGHGGGYECLTTEPTYKAIREQLKTYRANGDHAPMRIARKRVKLSPTV